MAHHGDNFPLSSEEINKLFGPTLGATGKFPEGKLNENDEGEIKIGVTSMDGKVVIEFGKSVQWIGFTPEQARQIAYSLQRNALSAEAEV